MDKPISDNIMDYLRGYAHADPLGPARLAGLPNLRELAQQEVQRRAAQFLAALPDDELQALAEGRVDLQDLVRRL